MSENESSRPNSEPSDRAVTHPVIITDEGDQIPLPNRPRGEWSAEAAAFYFDRVNESQQEIAERIDDLPGHEDLSEAISENIIERQRGYLQPHPAVEAFYKTVMLVGAGLAGLGIIISAVNGSLILAGILAISVLFFYYAIRYGFE
jgi:hypothetical protein